MSPTPSQPAISNLSEMEDAAKKAYQQFLYNQALGLIQSVRTLKVQLMLAESAKELSEQLKGQLYMDLAQCAAIVEVRDGA